MAKISRRKLIAAAAAPLAGAALNSAAHAAPARPTGAAARPLPAPKPDPVTAKVAAWMVAYDGREALIREWQDFETALFAKVRAMNITPDRGMRTSMAEARAMRTLDRKIKASSKKLDREAGRIVVMRATSAEGALAKIRLGVRIQGPYDWNDDHVYALVHDGCEQLALLLARKA